MKQLLLSLLFALLPVVSMAQDDTKRVPDEDDILHQTLSATSPYYYTNLMLKYRNGGEVMTPEEYFYLYYGYLYQEAYRPFVENRALDEMLLIMSGIDIEKPTISQLEALIERGVEAIELDPFNPKVLNMLAFAYGALGDAEREEQYFRHLNGILSTIESSGTGLRESSPWHILMFSHAYDLLASKGYPGNYDPSIRGTLFVHPPKLFISGHSHILKVMHDQTLNTLHINPGAAGIHGFHKVRTLVRFTIDKGSFSNLEVIELADRI